MALSFDGVNKVITLSSGTETLSVRDLWSRWVDWWVTGDNSKFQIAMENVGGNIIDLAGGTTIPIYVFLQNGWKIKPQEANHTLNVNDGILLVEGGGDPFTNTTGSYIIRINYQQPVQAISFSTEGGGGSGLTAAQVWQRNIENGLTAEEILRIIVAVLAGKTTVNTSGPYPIVSFTGVDGNTIRVVATMDGSERTSVVLDPD